MTAVGEDRFLQIDLAIVQLITSVLVTLGSALFAISIGFELTLPPAVKQAVGQLMIMNVPNIEAVQYELVQESLGNYVLLLAAVGLAFIGVGIAYGSAKISKIKKKMRASSEQLG
jgi:hypothetical protein